MSNLPGVVGSVAEPGRPSDGERQLDQGHSHESACLNCGTPLVGAHCHNCGQAAHLHRTAGAFLHDLLHGALHFEGKTWRTLPMLAVRPGELTRRYIDGERARFVSPMGLFLFCVFLMFAAFQIAGVASSASPGIIAAPAGLDEARGNMDTQRRQLEERIGRLPVGDPQRAELQSELAQLAEVDAGLESAKSFFTVEASPDSGTEEIRTGWAFADKGLAKFRENPSLMLYKLQANSYKFSWLLIPLSIPFVSLLFAWRRRFGAYDHAVFVTYSLSFMTLLFVALTLLGRIGLPNGLLALAGFLVPPLHIYRQIRGAYQLRRFSALWRTAALLVLIGIVALLFLNLLLMLGMFG